VYLHAYDSVSEARSRIGQYIQFFNSRRPHSSLVFSNPEMSLKGGFEAGSFRRLLCGDFLTCFSS